MVQPLSLRNIYFDVHNLKSDQTYSYNANQFKMNESQINPKTNFIIMLLNWREAHCEGTDGGRGLLHHILPLKFGNQNTRLTQVCFERTNSAV